MFASKENKRDLEELSNLSNAIARGTRIIGTIETHGNLRIDGELEGDIITKSKVVLGESSLLNGNVRAQNAEIAGRVTGTITVAEMLVLKPTAVIEGDITTAQMVVEAGAAFNGASRMGATVKDIKFAAETAAGAKEKSA